MKDTRLFKIFNDIKDVLCKNDYYIHTAKRILHLINTELKIPHLMGLQYVGRPNQYTGDFGVYAVKKGRITLKSLEKLIKKYYKTKENTKIVREDKITKQTEIIYQRELASLRGKLGVEKMLHAVGIEPKEKLVRYIMKLNVKFGEYHTLYMLSDIEQLMKKCRDKRDEALVKDFISLWRKCTDGI